MGKNRLASASADGTLRLWDLSTREPVWLILPLESGHAARITNTGELVVSDVHDEASFVYLIQASENGPVELLSPAVFRERFGPALRE